MDILKASVRLRADLAEGRGRGEPDDWRTRMGVERSRRIFLTSGTAFLATFIIRGGAVVRADALPEVTVYKSPT